MSSYGRLVLNTVARLIVLLAVLLMPLGMAPATAHHEMPAAMAMQHCPEPAPTHHQSKGAMGVCTMACASALPAVDLVQMAPIARYDVPVAAAVERGLDGLHPETATPPPKLG